MKTSDQPSATESRSQHTPGEWATERDGSLVIRGLVVCSPCTEFTRDDMALAAAAPELLAACKRFMKALEDGALVRDIQADGSPDFTVRMLHFIRDLNAAQLAIAKAEGRS